MLSAQGWTAHETAAVDSAIQVGRVGSMACLAVAFGWDASAYALAREAARLGLAAINARSN